MHFSWESTPYGPVTDGEHHWEVSFPSAHPGLPIVGLRMEQMGECRLGDAGGEVQMAPGADGAEAESPCLPLHKRAGKRGMAAQLSTFQETVPGPSFPSVVFIS